MGARRPRPEPLTGVRPGSDRGQTGVRPLLLAAVAVVLLTLLFSARISNKMRDFEVYWTAATRAVAAEPLYRSEDGHFQFKYLPAFAIAAAPLSALALPVAKATWLAISIALLVTMLALSLRLLPDRRRPRWFLVAVMLVAMGKFFGHELVLGQVNLLLAVLVVSGILAMRRRRDGLAATLFVCAVVVKPYAVLFLPWLAILRGWRAAAGAALGIACALGAPIVLYGVDGTVVLHRAWWATVTVSTAPNLTNPDNVSVAALTAKWLGEGASLPAAAISVALVMVACVVIVRGRDVNGREALEGALLLTLIPLLSPQGWDYVFLLSTPAIAMIANYDDRLPPALRILTWAAIATIGLSIYDLLGRELYSRFMSWSIITLCFFIVIAALATLRLRRV